MLNSIIVVMAATIVFVLILVLIIQNNKLHKMVVKPGCEYLNRNIQELKTETQKERAKTADEFAKANEAEQKAYANDAQHQKFIRDRYRDHMQTEEERKILYEIQLESEKDRHFLSKVSKKYNKNWLRNTNLLFIAAFIALLIMHYNGLLKTWG